eukprot:TRINITY_DN19752_c0_g1_i1.p1 TRINITY_DN19752_c0_g1~~TRINITY_DN19752_c0_g1_i1.p1  ORF type:complete len:417 (+),score=64.55 TRINITY_DN19752_c0_g1_i1:42-1292(+)
MAAPCDGGPVVLSAACAADEFDSDEDTARIFSAYLGTPTASPRGPATPAPVSAPRARGGSTGRPPRAQPSRSASRERSPSCRATPSRSPSQGRRGTSAEHTRVPPQGVTQVSPAKPAPPRRPSGSKLQGGGSPSESPRDSRAECTKGRPPAEKRSVPAEVFRDVTNQWGGRGAERGVSPAPAWEEGTPDSAPPDCPDHRLHAALAALFGALGLEAPHACSELPRAVRRVLGDEAIAPYTAGVEALAAFVGRSEVEGMGDVVHVLTAAALLAVTHYPDDGALGAAVAAVPCPTAHSLQALAAVTDGGMGLAGGFPLALLTLQVLLATPRCDVFAPLPHPQQARAWRLLYAAAAARSRPFPEPCLPEGPPVPPHAAPRLTTAFDPSAESGAVALVGALAACCLPRTAGWAYLGAVAVL